MANNVIASAVAAQDWQASFCDRYALLLLAYGRWFLLAALLIGAAGAAVVVFRTLYPPKPDAGGKSGDDEAGGATALQTIIDAVKGLVDAFAKAPTWLAMFGGGVLLLWMAGDAVPSYCLAPQANTTRPQTSGVSTGSSNRVGGNGVQSGNSSSN